MRIFSFIIILVNAATAFSQPIERRVADSLFKVLTKEKQGIERIKALNELAQFYIFKPGENQIDFDSATSNLNEANRLNQSVKSASLSGQLLLTESYMLREKGQRDSAISTLQEAIRMLESSNEKYFLGKTLYELSGYYDYRDQGRNFQKKINLVERAVSAFEQSKSILEKAEALKMLGDLYNLDYRYDKAIEVLNKALAAYNLVNHKALQGVYILLGDTYLRKNDYKQALYHELLALKIAERVNDTTMQICQIYLNLAGLYGRAARYEIGLKYCKEALKIAIRYDESYAVALTLFSISNAFMNLERPKEALDFLSTIPSKFLKPTDIQEKCLIEMAYMAAYLDTRQYSKAKFHCNNLLNMLDKGLPEEFQNIICRSAASYYLETTQFQKARFYLTRNIPFSKGLGIKYVSLDERIWYKLDSAEGNYQSAFHHLLTYKTISDSLFNATKARQFQQLDVEYETSKKQDSLKLQAEHISLLQQRNNLQQTNLQQTNFIKNISIVGTVLILIVLILLYYQFRKNQRSNKIILQKNEELKNMLAEKEWWLKEVHHRVKNNLHTIICLLESQAMYLEKDALQAIEKSQHRIYAMSLIHQKLYQNEDVRSIDMSLYLEEFLGYLKDSFDAEKIEFITEVDSIQLNLQQAIPVSLIINESITNSIKYAFDDASNSVIRVYMKETDNSVTLIISDNGKGFEMKGEANSLGLQLIKGLTKELRGTLQIETTGGTQIKIRFEKDLVDQIHILREANLA